MTSQADEHKGSTGLAQRDDVDYWLEPRLLPSSGATLHSERSERNSSRSALRVSFAPPERAAPPAGPAGEEWPVHSLPGSDSSLAQLASLEDDGGRPGGSNFLVPGTLTTRTSLASQGIVSVEEAEGMRLDQSNDAIGQDDLVPIQLVLHPPRKMRQLVGSPRSSIVCTVTTEGFNGEATGPDHHVAHFPSEPFNLSIRASRLHEDSICVRFWSHSRQQPAERKLVGETCLPIRKLLEYGIPFAPIWVPFWLGIAPTDVKQGSPAWSPRSGRHEADRLFRRALRLAEDVTAQKMCLSINASSISKHTPATPASFQKMIFCYSRLIESYHGQAKEQEGQQSIHFGPYMFQEERDSDAASDVTEPPGSVHSWQSAQEAEEASDLAHRLRSELAARDTDLAARDTDLRALRTEATETIMRCESRCVELEADIKTSRSTVTELESQAHEHRLQRDDALEVGRQSAAKAHEVSARLRRQLSQLQASHEDLEGAACAKSLKLTQVQAKHEEFELAHADEVASSEARAQKASDNAMELEAASASWRERFVAEEASALAATNTANARHAELEETWRKELQRCEASAVAAAAEASALRSEVGGHRKALEEAVKRGAAEAAVAEVQLQTLNDKVANLQAAHDNMAGAVHTRTLELTEAQQRQDELQRCHADEVTHGKARAEEAHNRLHELEAVAAAATGEASALRGEATVHREARDLALQQGAVEAESAASQIALLTTKLAGVQADAAAATAEAAALRGEATVHREARDVALQRGALDAEAAAKQVAQLNAQLAEVQAAHDAVTATSFERSMALSKAYERHEQLIQAVASEAAGGAARVKRTVALEAEVASLQERCATEEARAGEAAEKAARCDEVERREADAMAAAAAAAASALSGEAEARREALEDALHRETVKAAGAEARVRELSREMAQLQAESEKASHAPTTELETALSSWKERFSQVGVALEAVATADALEKARFDAVKRHEAEAMAAVAEATAVRGEAESRREALEEALQHEKAKAAKAEAQVRELSSELAQAQADHMMTKLSARDMEINHICELRLLREEASEAGMAAEMVCSLREQIAVLEDELDMKDGELQHIVDSSASTAAPNSRGMSVFEATPPHGTSIDVEFLGPPSTSILEDRVRTAKLQLADPSAREELMGQQLREKDRQLQSKEALIAQLLGLVNSTRDSVLTDAGGNIVFP